MYKKASLAIMILSLAFIFSTTILAATSGTGTVGVTASVLGGKPLVNSFSPTSGTNNSTTAITAIVGNNLSGATVVTLDDTYSTALTGTITISNNCDTNATTAVCGTGTKDKITGLTVPVSITPGSYNVLVTNANGTNISSDSSFTVSAPAATTNTAITSVSPNPVVAQASGGTSAVTLAVSDTNSATTYYQITTNGGTWSTSSGSIAMSSNAGSISITFTAGGSTGTFTNTFSADDTNAPFVGDDTQNVTFYIQPPW